MDQSHINYVILGGALIAAGAVWAARTWLPFRVPARATGKVLKIDSDRKAGPGAGNGGATACPTIHFEDHRGVTRVFTSRARTSVRYQAGDAVAVLYDSRNPANAMIYNPGLWVTQLIIALTGAGMVLYGLAAG